MKRKSIALAMLAALAGLCIPETGSAHSMSTTGPISLTQWCLAPSEARSETAYTSSSSDRTWVITAKIGLNGGNTTQFNIVEWDLIDNATGSLIAKTLHPVSNWVKVGILDETESITAHTGGTFSLNLTMWNEDTNSQCFDRQLQIAYATTI